MWDEDFAAETVTTKAPSAFEDTGFSVGRGRGFGNMSNMKNSLPQVGGNSTFNSAATNNDDDDSAWKDDDAWNEDTTQNSANNNTDFWSSTNNYNSRSNNDYSSRGTSNYNSGSNDYNSGGGFKSKSGSGDCFKCGEQGHRSRDCPRGGDFSQRRTCRKCNEEGHMARDCPNDSGEQKRSNACFKCKQEGHFSKDCPNSDSSRSSKCYKCQEEGHMARECPNSDSTTERKNVCFKCQEEGHMARECPNSNASNERKTSCFNCGEEGHRSKDCTNPRTSGGGGGGGGGRKCYKCDEEGHMAKDCPNPDKRPGAEGKPKAQTYIPPEPSNDATEIFQSVSAGINFSKYKSLPVDVSGTNPPPPISDFRSANLSQLLQKNIEKSGYTDPTPIQRYCIPIILKKRDVMACAETGSGKTAAFLLPILHSMITDPNLPNNNNNDVQEPIALILSPTRELAIQINKEARKFAYDSVVKTEVIYGGVAVAHHSNRIRRGIHVLVATPGRLHDFVEKGKISFTSIKYLVLDEADRMLDMGFMPTIEKIVENSEIPPKDQRQTLMFSATFPEEIQRLACKFLDSDYLFVTVGNVGGANADVTQTFFKLGQFDKRQQLMDILKESGSDRILVFVEQKRTADFLASFTSQNDIPTTSIHGDRLQREREEALEDFRSGKMPVLVATAVAARGLDIKDVRHVINYDLPQTIDEYVHRIGRTGRVGNLGKATSFYDPNTDQPLARDLKKILIDAQQEVPAWLSEEANMAVSSTTSSYSRGNFGGRDVRNQGRNNHHAVDSSDAWNDASSNNYSQPVEAEETWD